MPISTLSSKGQLVIPKEIREALGAKPERTLLEVSRFDSLRIHHLED